MSLNMRYIAVFFSYCLLLPAHAPSPSGAPNSSAPAAPVKPEDKCTIEGAVLNAVTGEAVKKVSVMLRSVNGGNTSSAAATDASGHYRFDNIDPGRYFLSADRTGFVPQQYGAKGPSRPGTMLTLTAGQSIKDAAFKLIPQGVVTGKVVDEDGDPVARVILQCQRYIYNNGKKQLGMGGMGNTNDLGEYRIFGLPPGRYYLSAFYQSTPQVAPILDAKKTYEEGYAPVYYPNAPNVEAAAPFEITPGAQLRGMDLTLPKTRTVRLRGVVTSSATNKPVRANVSVMSRDASGMAMTRAFGRVLDDQGNFEIHSVVPGSYFLIAQTFEDNKQAVARVPVEVGTSNIDGLQIVMNPPGDLSGRVVVENNSDTGGATFNVSLQSKVPGPFGGGSSARADKDGTFRIRNVVPDAYTLNVFGFRDNFYVKSVRLGDTDVTDAGIDFTRGVPAGEITVILSADGGQVDGTVQNDKSAPAAGTTVVLIPDADKRSNPRFYKMSMTDSNGKFSLKGITPGEYKLFAWEQIENGVYQDPDFLKRFESKGESVSVKEKAHETKQLKALPGEDTK